MTMRFAAIQRDLGLCVKANTSHIFEIPDPNFFSYFTTYVVLGST